LHLPGIEPKIFSLPIDQQEADINKLLVTSCTTVCTVVWQYLASIDAAILNPKYKILHPVRNFYAALTCLERNYPSVKHNNNNNNNNNNNKSTEHSPL